MIDRRDVTGATQPAQSESASRLLRRTVVPVTDAVDTDREQAAFDRAHGLAAQIVADLNRGWEASGSTARLSWEVRAGADDQPVFTFTLLLDLAEDFDPADWPADQVEALSEEIRNRLIGSEVDDWDWLVTSRAVAPIE